jgi:predicted lipoprotein
MPLPAAQEGGAPVLPELTDEVVTGIMTRAVDDVIRPGYRTFQASAGALAETTAAFCKAPSEAGRKAVDDAFRQAVTDWGHIEIVRIGPVIDDNRFERILFYPDRKGTGLKQVQALLQKQDEERIRRPKPWAARASPSRALARSNSPSTAPAPRR